MKVLVNNNVNKDGQAIKGLKKLTNARDIGGYVTDSGKAIKKGMILRSSELSKASIEDIKILEEEYKISKIIDIRDFNEQKLAPDPKIKNAENIFINMYQCKENLNLSNFKKLFKNATGSIGDMIKLLEVKTIEDRVCVNLINDMNIQNKIHDIFKILLNNKKGSVLIHCKRGNTRVGVVCALILYVLGVDIVTIFKDFQLSNEFYRESIDYYKTKVAHFTDDEEIIKGVEVIEGTDVKFLEEAFLCIEAKWGSIEDYIREAIGVKSEEINLLRSKYLK